MNSLSSIGSYADSPSSVQLTQTWSSSPFGGTIQNTASNYALGTIPQLANIGALGSTGVFTIEFWLYYPSTSTNTGGIFGLGTTYTQQGQRLNCFLNYPGYTNRLYIETGNQSIGSVSTIPTNTWTHVAYVKNSSNLMSLYINGTLDATATWGNSITILTSSSNLALLRTYPNLNQEYFIGRITGFAISKYAWYTSNFTPPKRPLNNDSTKILLLNAASSGALLTDSSGQSGSNTITNSGLVYNSSVPV